MIKISNILSEDIEQILDLADNVFKEHMSGNKSYISNATDWDISVKLLLDDNIIGFYLFKRKNLYGEQFNNKIGVQGVALGLDEKYRGNGYGKMLIEKSYELKDNFDYIWGLHLQSLNNIDDWKKRRIIMNENSSIFTSYTFLK